MACDQNSGAAGSPLGPLPATTRLRASLEHWRHALITHEPGTRRGEDPEELHHMRVAVRRMRALLKAGRSLLDTSWSEPLRAELGWLGRALGAVRDLDVLLERLQQSSTELPAAERAAADQLLTELRAERDRARERLLTTLDSARYRRLLLATEQVRTGPRPPERGAAEPLRELVDAQFAELRAAATGLGTEPTDAELHRVRIRTKQLRYTAELADQAPDVQLGELVRAAKQLQTVLGDHQDACVARDRVRQLLADAPGTDTASAAELLAGAEEQRRRRCRAAWPGKWRELLAAAQECGISG